MFALSLAGLGAWLWWPLEWAVVIGATGLGLGWGFLGVVSWFTAVTAERAERTLATAALNRRIKQGRAEPERAAISIVAPEDAGQLSPTCKSSLPSRK